jgi:hypothetical protein
MTDTLDAITLLPRDARQDRVARWCTETFGIDSFADRTKRALRLLEEALELYQAEGGDVAQATALADRVFSRPSGDPALEAGGVGVTLLSYCASAGLRAGDCEAAEIARVLSRPVEVARARYQAKVAAGF